MTGTCVGWSGVADRRFASAANRAYLSRGGGHYIHAEKLRNTNAEAAAALARQSRDHEVAGNLRVKGVWVPAKDAEERTERFTCTTRAGRTGPAGPRAIAHLEQLIEGRMPGYPASATRWSAR